MKNLAVLLVFIFSLAGVINTVTAEAETQVRVEQKLTAPVMLDEDDGSSAIAEDKKKKKKKDDGGGDDEESEEDYWGREAGALALELVDPGALEVAARFSGAGRR